VLTSAASSDETDLLSRHACTARSCWVTNVLVVTTTVRVLHRVHRTPADLWPAVALDAVLVECAASLHDWLVETTTARHDADGRAAGVLHPLLGAGRKTDFGTLLLNVLCDNGAVVAGATSDDTAVARAHLHVGDDGTLRHGHEWKGVASNQLSLPSAVQELAGVRTLHCWHEVFVDLVLASIVEVNLGQGCAATRVVDDVLHDTLDETDALTEVEHTELGCSLAVAVVRLEN